VRHVGFLRNVNQGQRGQPSTDDVRDAFAEGGATEVVPFQTNGTIVFEADDPALVIERAVGALVVRGHDRDGFWMPLSQVAEIVDGHAAAADASRRELTLHAGGRIDLDDHAVITEATKRRCVILATGDGWAVTANERDRESNATPAIERIIAAPATSRGLPTLVRLVDRFAPDSPA